MNLRLALCNCSQDEARELAGRLVEENLAACVNILDGITSVYRWEGEVCRDSETTLLIKTTAERYGEMEQKLAEYHSYDVPEIIGLDSADVLDAYAEWVHDQVR